MEPESEKNIKEENSKLQVCKLQDPDLDACDLIESKKELEKNGNQISTLNQTVKEEARNPWEVSSIYDFNFFCCPECDFKMKSDYRMNIQSFVDHASIHHPWAVGFLQQISDGSLDDIILPMKNKVSEIKEEPQEFESSVTEFDATVSDINKTIQEKNKIKKSKQKNGQNSNISSVKEDQNCEICGKSYSTLNSHMFIAHGRKNSSTNEALKNLLVSNNKMNKSKKQMGKDNDISSYDAQNRPFRCDICGKSYKSQSSLTSHISFVHEGRKPYGCDFCSKKYTSKDGLQYHVTIEHELKKLGIDHTNITEHSENPKVAEILRKRAHAPKKSVCKICGKEVYGKEKHFKEFHCDKNGIIKCPHCDMTFLKYNKAYSHVMRNHEKAPCSICGDMIGKQLMTYHMQSKHNINPPEKKFKCENCGKAFIAQNMLNDHINTHTGARPYLCKFCGKGFSHSGTYSRHIRSCVKR